MSEKDRLLRLREKSKRKRPKFVRQESWRYKRLNPSWRRPKGIDNKMRKRRKGWPKMSDVGYRAPRMVRGLHPSGLEDVLIHNASELESLNPDIHTVRIGRTVGTRKRVMIIDRASELNLTILNPILPEKEEELELEEFEEIEEEGLEEELEEELAEEIADELAKGEKQKK